MRERIDVTLKAGVVHVLHYVVIHAKSFFHLRERFLLRLVRLVVPKRRESDQETAGKIRLYTIVV